MSVVSANIILAIFILKVSTYQHLTWPNQEIQPRKLNYKNVICWNLGPRNRIWPTFQRCLPPSPSTLSFLWDYTGLRSRWPSTFVTAILLKNEALIQVQASLGSINSERLRDSTENPYTRHPPHSILNSVYHNLEVCDVLWRVVLQSGKMSTRIRQVALYNCHSDQYSVSQHRLTAQKKNVCFSQSRSTCNSSRSKQLNKILRVG
jgi:hypothetical protein